MFTKMNNTFISYEIKTSSFRLSAHYFRSILPCDVNNLCYVILNPPTIVETWIIQHAINPNTASSDLSMSTA